jgi:hypothetical protein
VEKETGKVGRGGSRGSAQVGAHSILCFFAQTTGAFPLEPVAIPFSRTGVQGHGYGVCDGHLFAL